MYDRYYCATETIRLQYIEIDALRLENEELKKTIDLARIAAEDVLAKVIKLVEENESHCRTDKKF